MSTKLPRRVLEGIFNTDRANAVKVYCRVAVTAGQVLVLDGMSGAYQACRVADPATPGLSDNAIVGVAAYAAPLGYVGEVFVPFHLIKGVNTAAGSVRDPVYLGAAGAWQLAAGTGIQIGQVVRDHAVTGAVLLAPAAFSSFGASNVAITDGSNYWGTDTLQGVADALVSQIGGDTDATYNFTEENVVGDDNSVYAALDRLDIAAGLLKPSVKYRVFDDFDTYQSGFSDDEHGWIKSGDAGYTVDVTAESQGVVQIQTNNVSGEIGRMAWNVPVRAEDGGLLIEFKLHLDSIANISVFVGLTDDATIVEQPAEVGGGDAITTTATDCAGFVFDTAAATARWFVIAADDGVDDAGNAVMAAGSVPAAGVDQRLQIAVSDDGATITFRLMTLAGVLIEQVQLTGDVGVSPDKDLYAIVSVESRAAANKAVDADYAYIVHNRV